MKETLMTTDGILELMPRHNIPESRENYLAQDYFGNPPAKLPAEEEFRLPNQFSSSDDQGFDFVSPVVSATSRTAPKAAGRVSQALTR
jgi:hypothetical protein